MKLPNIRKLFKPDPGYILFDCDLSGADAQVVAWEAEDPELKELFRRGEKIHIKNFELMYERAFDPEKDAKEVQKGEIFSPYDSMKRAVHGTNYGASARTIAATLGWSINRAEAFQRKWLTVRPNIGKWHKRVERTLHTTRTITNKFGYRIIYFDRLDQVLPQALAWVPQSTVAIVCSKGGVNLFEATKEKGSPLEGTKVLLQVHDSLVFQIPRSNVGSDCLRRLNETLRVPIPYTDPLTIGWDISASSTNWGDLQKIKWDGSNLGDLL